MSPFFVVLLLQAAPPSLPETVETKCEGFTLLSTSPSGQPVEDDERLELVIGAARMPVALQPAWFTGAGLRKGVKAPAQVRCRDGLVAWEVRPGVVVLVLSRSGRPGLDRISFALVDLTQRKVLQVLETQWELASARNDADRSFSFVVRAAKEGFDVRAVREWLPDDDSLESAMQDWLAVRVRGAKLSVDWLRR